MTTYDIFSSVRPQLGGYGCLETMIWGITVVMRIQLQYLALGSAGLAINGGVEEL